MGIPLDLVATSKLSGWTIQREFVNRANLADVDTLLTPLQLRMAQLGLAKLRSLDNR